MDVSRETPHVTTRPKGHDLTNILYMRNLLGWLRLGWLKAHYVTVQLLKLN